MRADLVSCAPARTLAGVVRAEFTPAPGGVRVRAQTAAPLELRGPFAGQESPRFFLRNVSAGVFSGDTYDIMLHCAADARVRIEPTAATKVYAMRGGCARQRLRLEAEAGALLDYDGGLTILQRDARLDQATEIIVHSGGIVCYRETVAFGRLARGERMAFARYVASLRVTGPDGVRRYEERSELEPARTPGLLHAAVAGAGVMGSAVIVGAGASLTELPDRPGVYAGASALPNDAGVLVRALGERAEDVVALLRDVTEVHLHARA